MLNAIDRIHRARIRLQKSNPFFAYLSLSLKPIEEKHIPTMAVDVNANLIYNPDWVESLNDEQVMGVLVHEILHLTLLHFLREGERKHGISNLAQDMVINYLIKQNNFKLPHGCIWTNDNNESIVNGVLIKDVDKKVWEEIYDELKDKLKNKFKDALKNGNVKVSNGEGSGIEVDLEDYEFDGTTNDEDGEGTGKIKNIDNHIKSNKGKGLSEEERKQKEREWLEKVQEAYVGSKMRGLVPVGIERLIGKLSESKINWKSLLLRYIESYIPSDYTYSKPNRKSISSGYFMPDVLKERIEVSVLIDVSGSIGDEELRDFIGEIVGIARAFRHKIKFNLYTHETNLSKKYVVENGSVEKIKQIRILGGGGTSFSVPYRELMKEKMKPKVVIWLTDGFGDTISKKDLKTDIIWCLSKGGDEELIKGCGKVIKIK